MNHRQEAAQKTRMSIIRAGEKLFRQRGFDDVTVSDITRAAGVTRTSFYAHFKSKDELLMLHISDLDEGYVRFYEKVLCSEENRALSPLAKLEMLLKESNRIIAGTGAELVRYYLLMLRTPRQPLTKRHYDELVRTLISECREKGLLGELYGDEDIFRAALALNRGICVEWALRDGDAPIEDWDVLLHNFCVSIGAARGD